MVCLVLWKGDGTSEPVAWVGLVGPAPAEISDPGRAAGAGRPRQRAARAQRFVLRESPLSFADARGPAHATTAARLGRQSTGLSTRDPAKGRSHPLQLS